MISVLPKHLVDEGWCRVDLKVGLFVVLFEVEELLVEGVDVTKESRLYLVFVEQHTHLCIRRIVELLSVGELTCFESGIILCTGCNERRMLRITRLQDNRTRRILGDELMQKRILQSVTLIVGTS